jgi:hypothetical protein
VPAQFVLGGPLRAGLGLILLTASIAVLWTSRTIELGIAWTAVVPSVVLLIPAWGLLQRRVLALDGGRLTATDGWLWRRALVLSLDQAELEVVPTAGLAAVVVHRGGASHALATWILPRTAHRLAAWLDAHLPAPLPRRATPLPQGDR